jgi:hypothetical protein
MLERYQIRVQDEETSCEQCGYPLYRTDYAWEDPDHEILEGWVFCDPECYHALIVEHGVENA